MTHSHKKISEKVVILAGGLGTRLSEETESKPKPMVLIDDKPILWHLMNIFSVQGYREFVLALGYRGDAIKRWLIDLRELEGDLTLDLSNSSLTYHSRTTKPNWLVSALETGLTTQTGGRILKAMQFLPGQRIIATYGDGLGNIDLDKLMKFHLSHGKLATITAVRPPARFGNMHFESDGFITHFGEKNQSESGWINGGFFVLEPEVATFIHSESEPFETGAIPRLVNRSQIFAFEHHGFWQPMDTLREKNELSNLSKLPLPPWLDLSV